MPTVVVRLLVGLVALAGVSPALAQFCPPAADPCIIASSVNVAGGTVIDVGTRDLVIAPSVTLTVLGSGTGALTVVAGDVTFEEGARIVAGGVDGQQQAQRKECQTGEQQPGVATAEERASGIAKGLVGALFFHRADSSGGSSASRQALRAARRA